MTRAEAIKILERYEPIEWGDDQYAFDMAIEALSADTVSREVYDKRTQADEKIIDSYRQEFQKALSAEAKPTVIRSKTLMPTKDFKEWAKRIREENPNAIVIPCDAEVVSANADLVRCKDCRWYDNRYGDVCHNPRYGDGWANYPPPYVDEDYWCKDGERKGGDAE